MDGFGIISGVYLGSICNSYVLLAHFKHFGTTSPVTFDLDVIYYLQSKPDFLNLNTQFVGLQPDILEYTS